MEPDRWHPGPVGTEPLLLFGAVLVAFGVLASRLAGRLGIPALLLFLGVGMLAGSDGLGGIEFDDAELASTVGVVALALIIFDGGLSTRWSTIRPVLGQGIALATVGVAATAVITGLAATWLLGLPREVGLLIGAIVSSTDAAAVFSVLRSRGAGLRGGTQPTLELESGANDPMAVFLTLGLLEVITEPTGSWVALLPSLVQQVVVGAVVGVIGGWLLQVVLNRVGLGFDGLYPVLTLTVAVAVYSGAVVLGGSGFLAVYLGGLWLGNHQVLHRNTIRRFHDAIAWLAQITMFLVLGLLVFPSRLDDVALRSVGVAAVLVLVARPVATALALTPFRTPPRDQAVVAWVGLRGATPIILATFPLVEGLPEAQLIFDVIFFTVVLSVAVQGTTVGAVSRLLRVDVPAEERPPPPLEAGRPMTDGTALREITVAGAAAGAGRSIVELALPERALLVLIERAGAYVVPTGATRLQAADVVLVLADEATHQEVRAALQGPAG